MAKKYKFDLTVDASALLQANPSEYYSLLYGMENAVTNYRVLPGIKNKTKVATVVFDKVLAEAGCDFNAQNADVSAVEIDVCALTSQASVCQYDLEQSWLALEMAKGSNSDFSVASFMKPAPVKQIAGVEPDEIQKSIEILLSKGVTADDLARLAAMDQGQINFLLSMLRK